MKCVHVVYRWWRRAVFVAFATAPWKMTRGEAIAIGAAYALSAVMTLFGAQVSTRPQVHTLKAFWWYVAALIISYVVQTALQPRPKPPQPQTADVPETKDGKRVIRIYGTVWLDEPTMTAMQQIDPPDPIQTSGGKK